MKKKQHYFTEDERYRLEIYKKAGKSNTWCAREIGVCEKTIYNELKRGLRYQSPGVPYYSAEKAQIAALETRKEKKGRSAKIAGNNECIQFLEKKIIDEQKSPANALREAQEQGLNPDICVNTLYNYIKKDVLKQGGILEAHEIYMRQALALAREAAAAGEVPVGCIIVREGEVVGRGRNRREEKQSTLSHAELEAMAEANARLGSWRLEDCTLYVTLEPCPMCAGAIINARIPRVYYGARDEAMGACGGVLNLFMEDFPHKPALVGGILEAECRDVLSDFFRRMRERDAREQADR